MKGALRHLSVALCALFFADAALGAACPVDSNGDLAPSWPTGRTPTGNWTLGSLSCGGANGTTPASCGTLTSYAQAVACADSRFGPTSTRPIDTVTPLGMNGNQMRYCHVSSGAGYSSQSQVIEVTTTATPCDPPSTPQCESPAGATRVVELPDANYPASTCVNNCTWEREPVTVCLSGGCTARYTNSGTTCSTPSGPEGSPADHDQEFDNCVVSGGNTYCHRDNQTNCGTVNGDYVCLPSTPGTCQPGAAGGKACESTAGTPPKPDAGVPGVPASPEVNITQNTFEGSSSSYSSNTYNYYNPGTVAGSTGMTPAEGGDPLCDPDVDANCGRTGEEWVDREYTPPGMPGFPENPYADYNAADAWGGDGFKDTGEQRVSTFVQFLSGTFPFSLAFSGPLQMFEAGTAAPTISKTVRGHTYTASLSGWNDLFYYVRIVAGVLLIFGAWLVAMATLSAWAK